MNTAHRVLPSIGVRTFAVCEPILWNMIPLVINQLKILLNYAAILRHPSTTLSIHYSSLAYQSI